MGAGYTERGMGCAQFDAIVQSAAGQFSEGEARACRTRECLIARVVLEGGVRTSYDQNDERLDGSEHCIEMQRAAEQIESGDAALLRALGDL
jgi:hypothetical protein